MKGLKKRVAALAAAAALAVSGVTGCGTVNADKVIAKVDDTEITMGLLNFYVRYQQGVYETNYAQMMGGIDAMWSAEVGEGKTYEQSMKETSIELLKQMCVLEDHMDEYEITLTEEEKAKIKQAVEDFVKANKEEELEAISGDAETVERLLTLMTEQKKMHDAITAKADMEVSDDEARRKGMQYVLFSFTKTKDDGTTETMTAEEKKELKKEAEAFAKSVKNEKDFEAFAEKNGYSAVDSSFGEGTTAPTEDMVKQLNELKVGGTTDVFESDNGYYVGRVTSELDRDATDQRKETIVQERKQEKFKEVYEGWEKEADITEDKKLLEKLDFEKQGVTLKTEEADAENADADSADTGSAEDSADTTEE